MPRYVGADLIAPTLPADIVAAKRISRELAPQTSEPEGASTGVASMAAVEAEPLPSLARRRFRHPSSAAFLRTQSDH